MIIGNDDDVEVYHHSLFLRIISAYVMSLISRGYPTKAATRDLLISLFNELMEEYPSYRSYIPTVTEKTVCDVIAKLNMKVRSQTIVDFIMGRYALIK